MSALHRLIHGGCRKLGLDDDARRGMYLRLVKKDSLSDMSEPEMRLVVNELRRLGYKPDAPKASGREGKPALDGKYLPKMRALWIALWNMGEVKDRRDSALEAFALGRQVPHLDGVRFIHRAEDGQSVVEALKAWLARAGVVWGDPPRCPDYMTRHGYKIARAQFRFLHPAREMQGETYFWPVVTGLLDLPDDARKISDAQWIELMNYLGKQVRAAKKKSGA